MSPRITIVVPTFNHPSTLGYSVESALGQTMDDLEVVIVCDGVGVDTLDVVHDLERGDDRVRHVEHAKSPRTGEPARHAVLQDCQSTLVGYLCDDDLLLPWHLDHLIETLGDRDFAHPLPLFFVDGTDEPVAFPMDLSDPRWVAAQPISSNHISLTGVVHTLAAYRRLPFGWRLTPRPYPTDDWMWRQWFEQTWFRGATAPHATTVKLPVHLRSTWDDERRRVEGERWLERMNAPGFADEWAVIEDAAVRRAAVRAGLESEYLRHENTQRMLRQWDVRVGELRKRITRAMRRA